MNELDKIKESLEKEFKIEIGNIELKKLSDGRDIIAFYDEKMCRTRLIDYGYARSLVTKYNNENNPIDVEIEEDPVFSDDEFTGDEFKKVVEKAMKKLGIESSVDEEYKKVINYSNNLTQLEIDFENKTIDENQYEFYKDLTENYLDFKSNSLKKISVRDKNLGYKMHQTGYIIIFVISFIAISIALIIILLMHI